MMYEDALAAFVESGDGVNEEEVVRHLAGVKAVMTPYADDAVRSPLHHDAADEAARMRDRAEARHRAMHSTTRGRVDPATGVAMPITGETAALISARRLWHARGPERTYAAYNRPPRRAGPKGADEP